MDDRSFEEFYRREYRAALALALVLTGDRTRAEDVTHDAFAAALAGWDDLENPAGWIRRVVANKARSAWRRRYAEQRSMSRLESDVRVGRDLPEETEVYWTEVRRLPRRQAQVVALFYLEDRPVKEIAEILGSTESTVRVHLTRARRALAKSLKVTE